VTVNAVAPGFIESEMTAKLGAVVMEEVRKQIPAHRVGTPEDLAAAVVIFSLRLPRGLHHRPTLVVDGGMVG